MFLLNFNNLFIFYLYNFLQFFTLSSCDIYKFFIIFLNYLFLNFFILIFFIMYFKFINIIFTFIYFSFIIINSNFFYYSLSLKIKKIPITLLIGLINIHPLLLYFSLFFIIFYFFSLKENCNNRLFFFFNIFIILFLAFLLGGFWGWFNTSWSYFWVYDYIEFYLLSLLVSCLIYLHGKNLLSLYKLVFLSFYIIFWLFLLLRLNFLVTRHAEFTQLKVFTKNFYYFIFIANIYFQVVYKLFSLFISYNYKKIILSFYLSFFLISLSLFLILMTYLKWSIFNFLIHTIFLYLIIYYTIHTANYQFFINFYLICIENLNNYIFSNFYITKTLFLNFFKLNFNIFNFITYKVLIFYWYHLIQWSIVLKKFFIDLYLYLTCILLLLLFKINVGIFFY